MTSATEMLRALLEERGVEYDLLDESIARLTMWQTCYEGLRQECQLDECNGESKLEIWDCTPEQAITATLERGTCHPDGHGNCSNCGKQLGVVRNCEMYETCDGRQAWKSLDHEVCDVPNYCPNCGAKVVGE